MNNVSFSTNFICGDEEYSTSSRLVNAPYIRKKFDLPKFKSAKLYICGLGFYRLFIGGKEITKGLLSPYISNPDDIVYFDEYDVSSLLCEGNNCIGIILGNGMQNALGGENWDLNIAPFVGSPKVALSLIVDGKTVLEADETFKWKESPILFDDLRYGVHYDARLQIEGWNTAEFDDSGWNNCQIAPTPRGTFRLNEVPPIVRLNSLRPQSILKAKNGYIYDFAYNSAGLCELKIKGEKGQKITLYYGEVVNDGELNLLNLYNSRTNRELAHIDIYYCSGNGVEVYEPSFTYHGFRYVYVEGITESQATEELLTFNIYSSGFDELSSFNCSSETANKLQAMCKNSVRSNFYHIPTDCPQREKNGWTGDAAVSVEHMLLNYGCEMNFKEWMRNVRAAQRDDGALPGIVPTTGWGFKWGNGPAWDHVIGVVPYYVYKYTGDTEILTENAAAIFKYLQYMKTKKQGSGFAYGLGDWCEVMSLNPTTPLEITDTLICYNLCQKAKFIFELLNMQEEFDFTSQLADEIYRDFRAQYIKDDGLCKVETQTAYTLLIAYKMLTEEESLVAVKRLVELIHNNNDKMRVGILGAREIFHVLSKYGYGDLAFYMIADDKYPSYGEWAKKGQTALWERFHQTEDGLELKRIDGQKLTSLNHHMFGDISSWFMQRIVGICVNPNATDHNRVIIKPCRLSEINYASGGYERYGNSVHVSWKKNGAEMQLEVICSGFNIEYDFEDRKVLSQTTSGDTTVFNILF